MCKAAFEVGCSLELPKRRGAASSATQNFLAQLFRSIPLRPTRSTIESVQHYKKQSCKNPLTLSCTLKAFSSITGTRS